MDFIRRLGYFIFVFMKKTDYNIHIIGAGVSGLIAAQVLENHGFHPHIIETTDRVGGRVKSDIYNGYVLDHGFQVLLGAYPAAQKYLDYSKLDLQQLQPGAKIYRNGKDQVIGDPIRHISFLFPTLLSSVGSLSDKLKIFKLNQYLKNKSIDEIFKSEEVATLAYLKDLGFSDNIITNFFKPFFTGIFLETELITSSRMFEFVYKMFGEGLAVIPKEGIQAISKQLQNNLKRTTFQFNTKVKEVLEGEIILEDGTKLNSNATIIATEASTLIKGSNTINLKWKSCDTLYFETSSKSYSQPLIGLISDQESLINNIFYHTSIANKNEANQELLSVTVVKNHKLSEDELITKVSSDLSVFCNIKEVKFLKRYKIKKALPDISDLRYDSPKTKVSSTIFIAGDQLLNGSLNAAMLSGEKAAIAVIDTIKKSSL